MCCLTASLLLTERRTAVTETRELCSSRALSLLDLTPSTCSLLLFLPHYPSNTHILPPLLFLSFIRYAVCARILTQRTTHRYFTEEYSYNSLFFSNSFSIEFIQQIQRSDKFFMKYQA